MIYVSTGGRPNKPAWETAIDFAALGIGGIELSGGKASKKVAEGLSIACKKAKLQPHNYFPPPEKPFVLNLASNNKYVYQKSESHIKAAIDIASLIGAESYSFHGGYLVDPSPEELGRQVSKRPLCDRHQAINRFVDRCIALSRYASGKSVRLLVENNVLSYNNYMHFCGNPFLMVDADECLEVMTAIGGNIGLLVDVAHLKVSAKTMCFDQHEFLRKVDRWIESYHLSDNDGFSDSNSPISSSSWFWPYLKTDVNDLVLEVYSSDDRFLLSQYELVLEMRK